ncbi:MAG: DUF2281 domain-containing protein [Magnetococcales bacterium]|nr:DUF2281 domain-containing protein [Magnetococcales bacterium]
MNVIESIQDKINRLPEPLAQEVLDFIGYLGHRHGLWTDFGEENLIAAQDDTMYHLWDNPEDEVWNDVQTL